MQACSTSARHHHGLAPPPCAHPAAPCMRLARVHRARPSVATASSASPSLSEGGGEPAPENDYQPFPRRGERDPYRLLGLNKEASFEEVQSARNFLYEQYRWHEPSRESIELAYEKLLTSTFKSRRRFGFRPPRTGSRTDMLRDPDAVSWSRRFNDLFDHMVTARTMINEGVVYGAMALWALYSSDQSFPLAGAFAYSIYKLQSKRMRQNPEGPFLGNNPMIGAVLSTTAYIGLSCAVMSVLSAPLASLIGTSMRQVGAFCVILMAGSLAVILK